MIPSQPPGIQASPKRGPMYAGQQPTPQPLQMASMLSSFGGAGGGGANRMGQSAPAGGANANPAPHYEIARDIGQQVEQMILQAKHASETKVIQEISKIKTKMDALKEKIQTVSERVNRLDANAGSLLKVELQKSISKLEEVWEGEVGTLKHELWQTIQAHNHNADLMKTHKDAIDAIQARTSDLTANPELEQIHNQLIQVEKGYQKEQAKQQQTDDFIRRLTLVQQQLQMGSVGNWAAPGMGMMGGMPPGIQAMPGANPSAPAGKKAQKKSKAKAKPSSAAANAQNAQGLRAEAPEFVPNLSFE